MPDTTTILSLPYILSSQAQKHVTHNEALKSLDLIVQLSVTSRALTVPPGGAAAGDRYIVAAAPTGAWAGQPRRIAFYNGSAWEFVMPLAGWRAWVADEGALATYDGTDWETPSEGTGAFSELGINTTADPVNRLTVKADAVLFDHETDDHRVKINKALTANTASVVFQKDYLGLAEFGLIGSNDFALKVSADGSSFNPALTVAQGSGRVTFHAGIVAEPAAGDISGPVDGALWYNSTTGKFRAREGGASVNLIGPGSAVFSDAAFGLQDNADASKQAQFQLSGISTATTRTYTLPDVSSELAVLGGAQTFSGAKTFSAALTASGGASVNEIGIGGATADATNKLSLNAAGALFNHAGAGHETVINKAASGDGAALSLKTSFSTRAQLGLLASDNFTLKVSPDGSSFTDALVANAASGQVTLAKPLTLTGQAADPGSPVDGQIWHNSTTGQIRGRTGGVTRLIDSQQDIPHLTQVAGEHILTTTGAGGATITLAGGANRIDLYPYIPRADLAATGLAVNVTTAVASALGKIVVYASDANGRPAALILETGDLDFSTTGVKTATISQNLYAGRTLWLGIRHSSTATLSAWALTATPDLNGEAPMTTARKTLRRTLTYATAAPSTWGFVSTETSSAAATAIWVKI
jgi:hypothetical protein